MDERFRAELLDEVHRQRKGPGTPRPDGGPRLGPHPDDDPLGIDVGRHGDPQTAEHGRAVADGRVEQVHAGRPDESGDEGVDRVVVQVAGRGDLLQAAAVEDGHPIPHGHRLHLIMGDVHGRGAQPTLQSRDLRACADPQLRVEVAQRFVHAEHRGPSHDGPAHRHALPLPARELARFAVEQRLELEHPRGFEHPRRPFRLADAGVAQRETHVLRHRHVRIQRVVLEHHRHVACLGRQPRHVGSADVDAAVVDCLEPGEHPQARGFPAARRTDQDQKLPVRDVEVEPVHRRPFDARVAVSDGPETYACQGCSYRFGVIWRSMICCS
ncbi:hypothetical protein AIIKEEIJ_02240 [Rhodococcus sp. YH1]|nr:hypothetical protein [Rhodococcus sp. YH1]